MENPVKKAGSGQKTPNDQPRYSITRDALPLHCPLPDMSLWNSHPRVYLPIEKTGEAKCPYCGTEFTLVDK
ncbi:MAG TPA: zinc-finger domain-containing protein [Gammaproteobacteria bacterium]|nr:zinc-finger domain-containing protein [Gammaproteobacteria bacterium]